jgi:hypothetical protein
MLLDFNMNCQDSVIKYTNYWFNDLRIVAGFISGYPTIMGLIFVFLLGYRNYFLGVIIGFISLLLFLLIIELSGKHAVNSLTNQKFPDNLNTKLQEHDAFIIIHSMGIQSFGSYVGVDRLIRIFIREQYPFRIYHCYNPEEFIEILKNDKTKYIWIFGHGWRGGIGFKWTHTICDWLLRKNKKTYFDYSEIQKLSEKIPKKLFIAQLHCNHCEKASRETLSLVELLLKTYDDAFDYYVTTDYQHIFTIWYATGYLGSKARRNKYQGT